MELIAGLGVRAYRFSIAWPRVQPDGAGPPNPAGLDFYRRLADALGGRDVAPVATLYHWDLPQALQDAGGWPNRDVASRFAEYAGIVAEALSGEVDRWITLNEPWVSAWLGYGTGVHAPGRTDDAEAMAASHHLLLAHGLASEAIRAAAEGRVGIALNLHHVRAVSEDPDDGLAADLADQHLNRLFLDPLFGLGYPQGLLERYGGRMDLGFARDGDLDTIATPLDFLGVNTYTTHTVAARALPGQIATPLAGSLDAWSCVAPDVEVTAMGWPIDPPGLEALLLRLHRDYPPTPLLITENGAAFDDVVEPDGTVRDTARIAYLRAHLAAALRAIRAGVRLDGYFVWSLMDNFEWAEGYSKRFGLIHVDYATQARTPKESGRWYRRVVERGSIPN